LAHLHKALENNKYVVTGANMQPLLEGGVNWGRGIEFTSRAILLVQWKAIDLEVQWKAIV
jgi:hypothetical protein